MATQQAPEAPANTPEEVLKTISGVHKAINTQMRMSIELEKDSGSISAKKWEKATTKAYKEISGGSDTMTPQTYIDTRDAIRRKYPTAQLDTADVGRAKDQAMVKNHTAPDGLLHVDEMALAAKVGLLYQQVKKGHASKEDLTEARDEWKAKKLELGMEKATVPKVVHDSPATQVPKNHDHSKQAHKDNLPMTADQINALMNANKGNHTR